MNFIFLHGEVVVNLRQKGNHLRDGRLFGGETELLGLQFLPYSQVNGVVDELFKNFRNNAQQADRAVIFNVILTATFMNCGYICTFPNRRKQSLVATSFDQREDGRG